MKKKSGVEITMYWLKVTKATKFLDRGETIVK